MTISRSQRCAIYALIGIVAFVATWSQVLTSLQEYGFVEGTLVFWQDLAVNASSRFIAIDILFLSLAVILFMLLEARRLSIPGVWLYVLGGLAIGISLFVPLFLLHRERKLAALDGDISAESLSALDVVGFAVMIAGTGVYSAWLTLQ